MIICPCCGNELSDGFMMCPKCGMSRGYYNDLLFNKAHTKKRKTALLLCIFLGLIGGHKFYEEKYFTCALYLLTLGLFGIGWLYDLCRLIFYVKTEYYVPHYFRL